MTRRALITGITGQDGSYLTELLLQKGYEVHGMTRNPSGPRCALLREMIRSSGLPHRQLTFHKSSLTCQKDVSRLCLEIEPHEIYNLAAQSHVAKSFVAPMETLTANANGTLVLLEAARECCNAGRDVRMYHASTSEMFGAPDAYPQNEQTPFRPCSPYACSKVYAFHQVVNYREAHGLYTCNGILFNHESPRRPDTYVTRKITRSAARIAAGLETSLTLGNLEVGRDWGFAREYVDAMWRMLQQDTPEDFVIATNQWHTLEEFLERAFQRVGLNWREHVVQDATLMRPAEVTRLQGDYSRARETLQWEPRTTFESLVDIMVDADVQRAALCQPSASSSSQVSLRQGV